jgi:hypothetical protein
MVRFFTMLVFTLGVIVPARRHATGQYRRETEGQDWR